MVDAGSIVHDRRLASSGGGTRAAAPRHGKDRPVVYAVSGRCAAGRQRAPAQTVQTVKFTYIPSSSGSRDPEILRDSSFEQRWRRRFAQRGAQLDDDAGIAGWTPTGLAGRVRQFRTLWSMSARAPGRWLDIGCGAGTYTRLLHAEGHQVAGLDYSAPSYTRPGRAAGGYPGWRRTSASCRWPMASPMACSVLA